MTMTSAVTVMKRRADFLFLWSNSNSFIIAIWFYSFLSPGLYRYPCATANCTSIALGYKMKLDSSACHMGIRLAKHVPWHTQWQGLLGSAGQTLKINGIWCRRSSARARSLIAVKNIRFVGEIPWIQGIETSSSFSFFDTSVSAASQLSLRKALNSHWPTNTWACLNL